MIYSIFRNNELLVNVRPLDTSELVQKKQSEDYIRLLFTLEDYIEVTIGDYISYIKTNQIYFLNKKPKVVESPKNYQYECIFEGSIHELKKTKIFLSTNRFSGGYYKDYKFPLTGNAQTFLDFIVDNLNRNGGGYYAGKYKETGYQTIEFNNWNAFDACVQIANTLGISWYLHGKELNFDEKALDKAYTLQVGRKVGFTSLTRVRVESENLETSVYGYGGSKNMPPRIADSGATYDSPLLTENRLAFVGVNGESKLEKNIDKYGYIESIQEFDDIFPERIGEITAISTTDPYIFYDDTIDFDIEQQKISGITPKLNFLTGQLIGLTFEIAYDNITKKVTIDSISDETGNYPNAILRPAVGDTYKIFDIVMPASYIDDAVERLQNATQAYIDSQSDALDLYEGQIDEGFIRENDLSLDLGDVIRVISSPFGIDNSYEIKELIQKITNPYIYSIKFGNILPKSLVALLKETNFNTEQAVYNISRTTITQNQITNQITNEIGVDLIWEEL